jgi:hypothetical protein
MHISSPLRRAHADFVMLTLSVLAVCLTFAPRLRADQSDKEATAILTGGEWQFGGRSPGRFFKADGTYLSTSPLKSAALWAISGHAIVIKLGNLQFTYPLPLKPEGTPGTDRKGTESMLVRMDSALSKGSGARSSATGIDTAIFRNRITAVDAQQIAAQIVQEHHDSLVFVTGTSGEGSGFIATMGTNNFLFTNAHVAAGIPDAKYNAVTGNAVRGDVPSVAIGEDVFCMSMPAGGRPLQIMDNVDANAAIGDAVVVLGNADGQGVVNTILGRIVGIGPNLVEVDAPFIPGNSGSPIIHLKTGKVIGVATYLVTYQYEFMTDRKLPRPVVRRFGYRIDNVKGWQAVNWRSFHAQAEEMDSVEALTKDLTEFLRDLAEHNGMEGKVAYTNPLIGKLIDDWAFQRGRNPSGQEAAVADANFLTSLKIACETDILDAQSRITYDYFRRDLLDQKQERDEIAKTIERFIEEVPQ